MFDLAATFMGAGGNTPFRRIVIIGVGLMGGSLGLAIKKSGLTKEVVGFSPKQSSLEQALKIGAIDTATSDLNEALHHADLVVMATPVETIINLLPKLNDALRRGCIVTDLGSSKVEIVEAAEKRLSNSEFFVGSHPLSGSEKKGVEFASADLFSGAVCIMTPTTKTNKAAIEKVKTLWTRIGSEVKFLTPEEHDEILGYVSHLPHLLSFALMGTVPMKSLEFITPSLKDMTRIAASSPQMWSDIFLSNSTCVLKSLDETVKKLAEIRQAITKHDSKMLIDQFSQSKEKRGVIDGTVVLSKRYVITIDGPAGAGKSTVAKRLAKILNISYLDTGAMYRALTLKAMRQKINLESEHELVKMASKTTIDLEETPQGLKVVMDGDDVTHDIRTQEVTNNTFYIARAPRVRSIMVDIQKKIGERKSIVAEGRDLGTVVFPHATNKFYLDANIEERSKRRLKELEEKGKKVDEGRLLEELKDRDNKDLTRSVGPLKKADDAILIDSTSLSVDDTVTQILQHIKKDG
jgi:prephenate dehydrogenase